MSARSRKMSPPAVACSLLLVSTPAVGTTSLGHVHAFPINLPAEMIVSVRVDSHGYDTRIRIEDDPPTLVDHPTGRSGSEWVVLGPYVESRTLSLAVEPKRRDPMTAVVTPAVSINPLPPRSGDERALRLITEAGIESAAATEGFSIGDGAAAMAALMRAAAVYDEAAEQGSPRFRNVALFFGAATRFELFDLRASLDRLDAIEADACVQPPYCYKQAWLRARIHSAMDEYERAYELLSSSIVGTEATVSEGPGAELDRADMLLHRGLLGVLIRKPRNDVVADLHEGLGIAARYRDPELMGKAHNGFATFSRHAYDYEGAARNLQVAARYLEDTPNGRLLAQVLGNLSTIHYQMSDYQNALVTSRRAVAVAEKRHDPATREVAYNGLIRVYERLGDYGRVESFAELAWQANVSAGREWRGHISKMRLATAMRQQGKLAMARTIHEECVQFFRQQDGSVDAHLAALNELARDHLAAGHPEEALKTIDEAWALRDRSSGVLLLTALPTTRAKVWIALERYDDASALLEATRRAYEDLDFLAPEYVEILHLQMLAASGRGDFSAASDAGDRAIAVIADVRSQLESQRLGPAWTSKTFGAVLDYVDILLEKHYLEKSSTSEFADKAFRVVNQGRGASLARERALTAHRMIRVDDQLAALRRELSIASHRRASSISRGDAAYAKAQEDYFLAMERYSRAIEKGGVSIVSRQLSLDDAARQLPTGTALVDYVCIPDSECHAFVVTPSGASVNPVGRFDRIERLAADAKREMEDEGVPGARLVEELGEDILQPVIPSSVKSLLFVADYPLNTLPLAVLDIEQTRNMYRPMLRDYDVTMLPSALTLSNLGRMERKDAYRYDLAIVADPIFSVEAIAQADPLPRSDGDGLRGWADELKRLDWSVYEAQSIEDLFGGDRVLKFVGREATKKNLLSSDARSARFLHIASHAFFDPRAPDIVGIATTPAEGGDASSGFVTLQELLAWPFESRMVVISGCETGRGANMRGEGLMSLARGFLARGADTVVATHWPVSDRASAMFMRAFYEALDKEGVSAAHALRRAQIKLMDEGGFHDPFYWGAYVLESATATAGVGSFGRVPVVRAPETRH